MRIPFVGWIVLALCGCNRDALQIRSIDGAALDAKDAFAAADGKPAADAAACLLTRKIAYRYEGGLRPSDVGDEASELSPERTFLHRWTWMVPQPKYGFKFECKSQLLECGTGDAVDTGDVLRALADPDVVSALGEIRPPLFGIDSRFVDGRVFIFDLPDAIRAEGFIVGLPCSAGSPNTCRPIPNGIKTLQSVLGVLDQQQTTISLCPDAPSSRE